MKILKLENFTIGNQEPMTLMGGVNVLESESVVMAVAEKFAETTSNLNINWSSSFAVSQNQLCPPYPSCIEDYVGYQRTSGCD